MLVQELSHRDLGPRVPRQRKLAERAGTGREVHDHGVVARSRGPEGHGVGVQAPFHPAVGCDHLPARTARGHEEQHVQAGRQLCPFAQPADVVAVTDPTDGHPGLSRLVRQRQGQRLGGQLPETAATVHQHRRLGSHHHRRPLGWKTPSALNLLHVGGDGTDPVRGMARPIGVDQPACDLVGGIGRGAHRLEHPGTGLGHALNREAGHAAAPPSRATRQGRAARPHSDPAPPAPRRPETAARSPRAHRSALAAPPRALAAPGRRGLGPV